VQSAGLPPVEKCISPGTAYLTGLLLEILYALFRIKSEPRMTRFLARQLSTSHWFNIYAARIDLGFSPSVSMEEGFLKLEQWLKKE